MRPCPLGSTGTVTAYAASVHMTSSVLLEFATSFSKTKLSGSKLCPDLQWAMNVKRSLIPGKPREVPLEKTTIPSFVVPK